MFDPTILKPGDLLQYSGVNVAWPFTEKGKRLSLEECWSDTAKNFEPAIVLADHDGGVVVFLEYYRPAASHWLKVIHPEHGVVLLSRGYSQIQRSGFRVVPTS